MLIDVVDVDIPDGWVGDRLVGCPIIASVDEAFESQQGLSIVFTHGIIQTFNQSAADADESLPILAIFLLDFPI